MGQYENRLKKSFKNFLESDTPSANIYRGLLQNGLNYANLISRTTGNGQWADELFTPALRHVEGISQSIKKSQRTAARQAEVEALQKQSAAAKGFFNILKHGGAQVYDTLTHPSEWNVGEFIGENIDPMNLIPGGKGIIKGAMIGASLNAAQSGAFDLARSDKSTTEALAGATLAGIGGGVLGGVSGAMGRNTKAPTKPAKESPAKKPTPAESAPEIEAYTPPTKESTPAKPDGVEPEVAPANKILAKDSTPEVAKESTPDSTPTYRLITDREEIEKFANETINSDFFKTHALELEPRADMESFKADMATRGIETRRLIEHFLEKARDSVDTQASQALKLKPDELVISYAGDGKMIAKMGDEVLEGEGINRLRYLNYIAPTLEEPLLKAHRGEKSYYVKSFTYSGHGRGKALKRYFVVSQEGEKIELITAFPAKGNYLKNIVKSSEKVEVEKRDYLGSHPSSRPYTLSLGDTITPSDSNVKNPAPTSELTKEPTSDSPKLSEREVESKKWEVLHKALSKIEETEAYKRKISDLPLIPKDYIGETNPEKIKERYDLEVRRYLGSPAFTMLKRDKGMKPEHIIYYTFFDSQYRDLLVRSFLIETHDSNVIAQLSDPRVPIKVESYKVADYFLTQLAKQVKSDLRRPTMKKELEKAKRWEEYQAFANRVIEKQKRIAQVNKELDKVIEKTAQWEEASLKSSAKEIAPQESPAKESTRAKPTSESTLEPEVKESTPEPTPTYRLITDKVEIEKFANEMSDENFFKPYALELEPSDSLWRFIADTASLKGRDRVLNHFADKTTLKDEFGKYEGEGVQRFHYLNYIVPTIEKPLIVAHKGDHREYIKPFLKPSHGDKKLVHFLSVVENQAGELEMITAFKTNKGYIKKVMKEADKVEIGGFIQHFHPYSGITEAEPYLGKTLPQAPDSVKSFIDEAKPEPLSLEGIPRLEHTIKRAGEYLKGLSPAVGVEKLGHFLRAADKHGTRPLKVANPEDSLAKNLARVHIPNFGKRFARNFIYGGGLSDREVDLYSKYRLERSARDFEAEGLIKEAKALSKEDGEALHLALGGEKPLGELSPRLFPLYQRARAMIDKNADELIELGELKESEKVEHYIARAYEKDVKEATSLWEVMKRGGGVDHIKARRGKEVELTTKGDYEAGGTIKLKDGFEYKIEAASPLPKGGTKLKLWRDYTFDERTELGEIREAAFTLHYTLKKQHDQIARARLLQSIPARHFEDADLAKAKGYVKVPDEASEVSGRFKTYGVLSGKYISATHMDHLNYYLQIQKHLGEASQIVGLANAWRFTVSKIKINHTVLNPGTHLYNVLSNVVMMALNDPKAFLRLGNLKEALEHGEKLGIVEGELRDLEPETLLRRQSENSNIILKTLIRAGKELLGTRDSTAGQAMRKAYAFEDNLFKALVIAQKRAEGMSDEQALKYLQTHYVDYTKPLPTAIRNLDQYGLSPFLGFAFRSTPPLLRTMANHPVRTALLLLSVYNVGKMDEEERALTPAYARGSTNMFFMQDWVKIGEEAGKMKLINFGRALPGFRVNPLETLLDIAKGDYQVDTEFGGYVGTIASIMAGRGFRSNTPLAENRHLALSEKALALGENLLPRHLVYLPHKVYKASKGQIDPHSGEVVEPMDVLASFVGGKVLTIDKNRAYESLKRSARAKLETRLGQAARGEIGIDELEKEIKRLNKHFKPWGQKHQITATRSQLINLLRSKMEEELLKTMRDPKLNIDEKRLRQGRITKAYQKLAP